MNRRRRHLQLNRDGSVTDLDTMRWYLDSLVRPRPHIERLSKQDPDIVAFEATARGIRAERVA